MRIRIVDPVSILNYLEQSSADVFVVYSDRLSMGLAEDQNPIVNSKLMRFAEVHVLQADRVGEYYFKKFTRQELLALFGSLTKFPCEVII